MPIIIKEDNYDLKKIDDRIITCALALLEQVNSVRIDQFVRMLSLNESKINNRLKDYNLEDIEIFILQELVDENKIIIEDRIISLLK